MVVESFEDFADVLAAVQDAATANEVARRVHDDFMPRLDGIVENMTALQARFGAEPLDAMV